MGKDSNISWCDNTFNGWWGCSKVDSDCKNCYADTLSGRWGFDIWGVNKPRRFFSDKHWAEPIKWNFDAEKAGTPVKVFLGSMMDWAEDREDLKVSQTRLFNLIEATPWIIWQMLTKRPGNAYKIIPDEWKEKLPDNVWMGTSVGHNKAKYRIDELKKMNGLLWLSCEPQTEDLEIWNEIDTGIDWIVCGGESGTKSRPFKRSWAINLMTHCNEFGIPFWMKQFGSVYAKENKMTDSKGGDINEFPTELQVREFPKLINI